MGTRRHRVLIDRLAARPELRGLRSAYRALARRGCALVHRAVLAAGPARAPSDLVLKHTYDWQVHATRPERIAFRVPTAVPRPPGTPGARGWLRHARRRLAEGGAWKSARSHLSRNVQGRFVLDGDWDLARQPFVPLPSLVEMFRDGVDYRDTEEYRWMRAEVSSGDFRWTKGCTTLAEVDRYFADLAAVFSDIRTNGYRTQRELGLPGDDEIRVCVDRDGRLCVIGGGTHRLSIAVILGLDRVPVVVKRVHREWVGKCLRRYGGDTPRAVALGLDAVLSGQTSGPGPAATPPRPR